MKRAAIFLILVLLIAPTILAAEDTTPKPDEKLSPLAGGLDEKTKNIFNQEIHFPQELEFLNGIITGGSENATWNNLIIMIGIAIFLFISFLWVIEFTAFETVWVKFTIAGTLTFLLITFGIVRKIRGLFQELINNFWILLGIILVAIILLFIGRSALNITKRQNKISKAEEIGLKSGAVLKGMTKTADKIIETGKKNNL